MPDVKPKSEQRPAAGGTPRGGGRKTPPRTSTKTQIKNGLTEQTQAIALLFTLRGDLYPSKVMEHTGPQWAENMAELAESSPQLKRILTLATEGGVAGAAIISTFMMVGPILAYYDKLPVPAQAKGAIAQMPFGSMTEEDVEAMTESWNMKHGDAGE